MSDDNGGPTTFKPCLNDNEKCKTIVGPQYSGSASADTVDQLQDVNRYLLYTLASNSNTSFTYDELAAHMPFFIDRTLFDRCFKELQDSTSRQHADGEDCIWVSPHVGEDRAVSIKSHCLPSLLKTISSMEGGISPELLKHTTPSLQEISDMFDQSLQFYDEKGREEREFRSEDRNAADRYQVFAWPCRFVICYLDAMTTQKQEILAAFQSKIKSVSHHYGDYATVFVAEKVSRRILKTLRIQPGALLTWGDFQRFLDFSVYERLGRSAPTVEEWSRVFMTHGVASYVVLDILKERANGDG